VEAETAFPRSMRTPMSSPDRARTFGSMEEIRRTFFPSLCPFCGESKEDARTDFERLLDHGRICQCGERFNELEEARA
jgi:hypothetical protein